MAEQCDRYPDPLDLLTTKTMVDQPREKKETKDRTQDELLDILLEHDRG